MTEDHMKRQKHPSWNQEDSLASHGAYKDHVTHNEVRRKVTQQVRHYKDLPDTVKKRKLRWYGHVTHSERLTKTILQGTVQRKRRWGTRVGLTTSLNRQGKASLSFKQSATTAPAGGASWSILHPSRSAPTTLADPGPVKVTVTIILCSSEILFRKSGRLGY
ncbi:hypothetical protein RRG08_064808 [Elysia crispata]|uniref:Uncharacterized protein n=1 Tax=Elysia crispata TaxID=231223 RepID=A0AAE1AX68_9GAST|nr:hypothetical protein RRG08_064808 [Elysia crispata]